MARQVPLYIILFLVLVPHSADAQRWKLRRYEAMAGVGTYNYFGDIGGSADRNNWWGLKDIEIFNTRPSFYLGARYKIRPDVAVKMNFLFGWITGDDEGSVNDERGYAFTTRIFEPSVQAEYSLISEEQRRRSVAMFNKRGMMNNYSQINLYLYAGIGSVFYHVNVNETLENAPKYNPDHPDWGLVIPAGIGLKYIINERLALGAEFGVRWNTSDYLDGYTSKFSHARDLYYFANINGIYRIRTSRTGFPILFNRGGRPVYR